LGVGGFQITKASAIKRMIADGCQQTAVPLAGGLVFAFESLCDAGKQQVEQYLCCLGTIMFALDIRHINESRALQTRMRHKFAVG
jgi:hypothetical protein